MGRETIESIQGAERIVYKGTSISSFRYRQINEDGGGCIGLYNRRSIVDGM